MTDGTQQNSTEGPISGGIDGNNGKPTSSVSIDSSDRYLQ
jgi:hypothetical protein